MIPTILFVDDDKEDEEMTRECLEKLGFVNFSFCPDGKTALSHLAVLANNQLPNLVVLDLQLPDLDGLELAKALNGHERFGGMWVVIYSGSLTPSIKIKLKEAGVVEIFQKPTNVQELNSILTKVIQLANEHHKQLTTLEENEKF
jgi:CheY-like chemotaxis protein